MKNTLLALLAVLMLLTYSSKAQVAQGLPFTFAADHSFLFSDYVPLSQVDPNPTTTITVYPNPVATLLTITSNKTMLEIVLTNTKGVSVYSSKPNNTSHAIDMTNYAKGGYTLKIVLQSEISQRLVITQ